MRCACVLKLGFRLRPGIRGCGVWVCVSVYTLVLHRAIPGWGSWCVGWVLPATLSCAVVHCVLCALPGFAATVGHCSLATVRVPQLWLAACLSGVPNGPAWCAAPILVRLLPVLRSALASPWCLLLPRVFAPRFTGRPRQAHRYRPRTRLMVLKPVRSPAAILGSLGVCIYVPASRHWLISYSPIHLT